MGARILLVFVIAALVGCESVRTVPATELIPLQTTSSFHPLFYIGSDQGFHYFRYLSDKAWREYRVPHAELDLTQTFTRSSNRSDVMWPGTLEQAVPQ